MGGEGDEMTKICVTFYFPFDYDVSGITSYLSLLTDDGAYHIPRVSPLLSASGFFFFSVWTFVNLLYQRVNCLRMRRDLC